MLRMECTYLFYIEGVKTAMNSFLDACSNAPPEQPIWLREASVRPELAPLLHSDSPLDAEELIKAVEHCLDVGITSEPAHLRETIQLLVDKSAIQLMPDDLEKCQAWVSLADRAGLEGCHFLEDIVLGYAVTWPNLSK